MSVFVLDRKGRALMPCTEKRAAKLLSAGRARVHRLVPFVIRLVDRQLETSALQPLECKLDPGSKFTGIAVVRVSEQIDAATGEIQKTVHVLSLLELMHRGRQISEALTSRRAMRRARRNRNTRYRAPRFLNRGNISPTRNRSLGWPDAGRRDKMFMKSLPLALMVACLPSPYEPLPAALPPALAAFEHTPHALQLPGGKWVQVDLIAGMKVAGFGEASLAPDTGLCGQWQPERNRIVVAIDVAGCGDLEATLLHEVGHALGLGHSRGVMGRNYQGPVSADELAEFWARLP